MRRWTVGAALVGALVMGLPGGCASAAPARRSSASAVTSFDLEFTAAVAGTIADKDGQGTGFTAVQANTTGSPYKKAKIDLVTSGNGTLRITSTAGTSTNKLNSQQNALELPFNGTRPSFVLSGRLLHPTSDLNSGFQQKGIYFGPDQDNYLKIEVENDPNNGNVPRLSVVFEQAGKSTLTTTHPATLAGSSTVDLMIAADPSTGVITASFAINGGAPEAVPGTWTPSAKAKWFSTTTSRAGLLTSNKGTTTSVVAVYDSFKLS
jgi:hypothetical protein